MKKRKRSRKKYKKDVPKQGHLIFDPQNKSKTCLVLSSKKIHGTPFYCLSILRSGFQIKIVEITVSISDITCVQNRYSICYNNIMEKNNGKRKNNIK